MRCRTSRTQQITEEAAAHDDAPSSSPSTIATRCAAGSARWASPQTEIDPTARKPEAPLRAGARSRRAVSSSPMRRPMLLLDEEYGVDAIPARQAERAADRDPGRAQRPGRVPVRARRRLPRGDRGRLDPDAVKALVRYNVAGDAELNRRSRERLVLLQESPARQRPPLHARAAGPADRRAERRARRALRRRRPPGADASRRSTSSPPTACAPTGGSSRATPIRDAAAGSRGRRLGDRRARLPGAGPRAGPRQRRALGAGRRSDRRASSALRSGRTLWTDAFAAVVKEEIDEQEAVRPDRGRLPGHRDRLPPGGGSRPRQDTGADQ